MDEKDEEVMLEKYNVRPGEIRVKLDLADWLLYASEELARLNKKQKLISIIIKTRMRMRYGVKEELLPLLKLQGVGRVRARKLFNNGIKDIGDVTKADVTTLAHIIGKNIAFDIKKQVGQDMGKVIVPERKRKGQISLKDFGE
jgi:helicase